MNRRWFLQLVAGAAAALAIPADAIPDVVAVVDEALPALPAATPIVGELYGVPPFVPELWANEIVAAYEKSLVFGTATGRVSYTGSGPSFENCSTSD